MKLSTQLCKADKKLLPSKATKKHAGILKTTPNLFENKHTAVMKTTLDLDSADIHDTCQQVMKTYVTTTTATTITNP